MSPRQPPGFWWQPPGAAARLLAPLALLYGTVAARRMGRPGAKAPIPVLCVGNFTVGGQGKTPTALWIGEAFRTAGRCPAFLLRGYGGTLAGPVRVDPARHGSQEVGDEALLLARVAPTIVARDRVAGADLAARLGADLVVMDDGLQNPTLVKDMALAVVDGAVGLGNGRVLPAGPLRAPAAAQWPRIQAVVVIGAGAPGQEVAVAAAGRGLPVLAARLVPDPRAATALAGRRVLAFAGIGRPEKFFTTLRELGAEVAVTRAFPDHHPYDPAEVAAFLRQAGREDLVPVTTEKDLVRLSSLRTGGPDRAVIRALPVRLAPDDPDGFLTLLSDRLDRSRAAAAGRDA